MQRALLLGPGMIRHAEIIHVTAVFPAGVGQSERASAVTTGQQTFKWGCGCVSAGTGVVLLLTMILVVLIQFALYQEEALLLDQLTFVVQVQYWVICLLEHQSQRYFFA